MKEPEPTPAMPLAGGDYIHTERGIKQVAGSTQPPAPKSGAAALPPPAEPPTTARAPRKTDAPPAPKAG